MPSRNPAWLNANETRPYPLADSADLRSVQGQRLPHDIIADINLRYPNDLGAYPYLAAVGVTDQLVSLTIQAATSLTDTSTLAPIAALGLAKPVVEGRPYALLSQYPGAGGWVVFGSGIQENFSGRFLGPQRSLLSPRAARTYRTLPVSSMAKLNALTALTGLVRLSGRSPIEVVKEERTILGVNQDVVVFRLIQPPDDAIIDNETTIFREFLAKCGQRPESKTCGDPDPIEFINTVRPDCNGNITIEFQGCAQLARVLDGGGILLDCELGLIDACATDTLADINGKLRTDYPDECESETKWLPFTDFENTPDDGTDIGGISESVEFLGALPYYDCFAEGCDEQWQTINGLFQIVNGTSPDPACNLDAFSASDSESEPEDTAAIDFSSIAAVGYDPTEDVDQIDEVQDSGATLKVLDNSWRAFPFSYTVTPNTRIRFDYKTTAAPDTALLGWDSNLIFAAADRGNYAHFYGDKTKPGYNRSHLYTGSPDWQTLDIPFGKFADNSSFNYLVFANNNDSGGTSNSFFRNVRVYESDLVTNYFLDSSFAATDVGRRNIALWNSFDDSSLNRRTTVDFKMMNGGSGANKNAGVILNYRAHPTIPGRYQYFLVELNHDDGELRIRRWNGTNFVIEPAFVSLPGLSLDLWYRLVIETTPGAGDTVDIDVSLVNIDAPAVSANISLNTSNFLPDTGLVGLHSNRAFSQFSSFVVEDIS